MNIEILGHDRREDGRDSHAIVCIAARIVCHGHALRGEIGWVEG